jgi:ABC-type glycerol-3-phosphate transport system substrate-binding protein
MGANSPVNKNNKVWIFIAVAAAILVLCCCGVIAALIIARFPVTRTIFSTQPTPPNTPASAILLPTDTAEPAIKPQPTSTPAEATTPTPFALAPTATTLNPVRLILWTTSKSDALNKQISSYEASNPNVTISVTVVTRETIINQWLVDVNGGTAPDLMLADNSSLWKLVKAQAVQPLDDVPQTGLKPYTGNAINGMTIDNKLYGIPVRFELAALLYNSSVVENPPKTTAELSLLYRTGSKFGIVKSPHYMMGFFTAFGGSIADNNGRCISTVAGFEDALNLMRQIRKYGSFLADDPTIIRDKFKNEQISMVIDDSSQLPDYVQALGSKLASVPIPGAVNPASAILQQTGFFINPKSQNTKSAIDLALALSTAEAQTAYLAEYWVPTRSDVQVKDPALKGFVAGAQDGYLIPQAAWFANWEPPFQDMINQVLNNQFEIPDAVRLACKAMNTLNNK